MSAIWRSIPVIHFSASLQAGTLLMDLSVYFILQDYVICSTLPRFFAWGSEAG